MNRYATLAEEVSRYNSMAGSMPTTQTCWRDNQPQPDKEATTPSAMEESIDTDAYEDVVFLQGSEADEALHILENQGQDAALNYLTQWHMLGQHMGSQGAGHGSRDHTYEKDGYIMSWNTDLNYIGLQYKFPEEGQQEPVSPAGENHITNNAAGGGVAPVQENVEKDPRLKRLHEINKFLLAR